MVIKFVLNGFLLVILICKSFYRPEFTTRANEIANDKTKASERSGAFSIVLFEGVHIECIVIDCIDKPVLPSVARFRRAIAV